MADKNERIYVINLRREFLKAPNYKRTSKSIRAIKQFISHHMKTNDVLIGQHLNKKIWSQGRKNPPSKIEVKAIRQENKVLVELVNVPIKEPIKDNKKKSKKEEKKVEEPSKEEVKKEMKEELKLDKALQKEKVPTASELKAKKNSKN